MATTEELATARYEAEHSERSKLEERTAYVSRRMEEERKRINSAADDIYGEDLKRLNEAATTARAEHRQRLNENARNGVGAKYPVNSVLYEWAQKPIWGTRNEWEWYKTGKTAHYVAVTDDLETPDNLAHYSLPEIGTFALQIIKKDGTPGKALVSNQHKGHYHPEEWQPPQQAVEA